MWNEGRLVMRPAAGVPRLLSKRFGIMDVDAVITARESWHRVNGQTEFTTRRLNPQIFSVDLPAMELPQWVVKVPWARARPPQAG